MEEYSVKDRVFVRDYIHGIINDKIDMMVNAVLDEAYDRSEIIEHAKDIGSLRRVESMLRAGCNPIRAET